jgi:DNA invertase Pin-like site-specific DNA recombinase
LRVFHLESLNGTSFKTQEKRIKNYAELHYFQINFVHSEVVSGGVDFKKRKVFQKILKQFKLR